MLQIANKVVIAIFVLLYTLQTYHQVDSIDIINSFNVTEFNVGQPFTQRCTVPHLLKEYNEIGLNFIYFNNTFAQYLIEETSSPPQYIFTDYKNKNDFYLEKVTPLTHNGTVFELSIVANHTFKTDFYCLLNWESEKGSSNIISVSVQDPKLETKFSTNTSIVQLNESFTATCFITNSSFAPAKNLSINFYNSRDGLLGSYEVKASGESFLSAEEYPNVIIHHGPRSTLPTFDLVLTEKTDRKLSYWCELVDLSTSTQPKFETVHWKSLGPFVDFTSKLENGNKTYSGTCSIDSFDPAGKSYSVMFYSNLGVNSSSSGNLLGQFNVKPNKVGEFDAFHNVPRWTLIHHGASVKWPTFEVIGRPEVVSGDKRWSWWCVFSVEGNTNKNLYKSNLSYQ